MTSSYKSSHYNWLDENLTTFLTNLGVPNADSYKGLISAHGDKCYTYKYAWDLQNIPFNHGVAIYLLTYLNPYAKECRETDAGWVVPCDWVAANYQRFFPHLPKA